MLLTTSGYQLALFCLLIRSCQAVKNGATETLNAQLISTVQDTPSSNVSMNQARNGGRRLTSDARKGELHVYAHSKWINSTIHSGPNRIIVYTDPEV